MRNSSATVAGLPVHIRRHTRNWLTTTGEVAEQRMPRRPVLHSTIEWEAHVVDTATTQEVKDYPHLCGRDVVPHYSAEQENDEVVKLYVDRCRYVDGPKPDIKTLQDNVNAGVWSIVTAVVNKESINVQLS